MEGRTRRASFRLAIVAILALVAAGCDAGTGPAPAGTGCDHWCGNGSATVTIAGTTTSIAGGGCYDGGSAGVDARFGDWGENGIGDFLTLTAYRAGGPTPTPIPTPSVPPAGPTATGHPNPNVAGSVNGAPFVLGTDTVVSLSASGYGAFSGTDMNGAGLVKGTFTCG